MKRKVTLILFLIDSKILKEQSFQHKILSKPSFPFLNISFFMGVTTRFRRATPGVGLSLILLAATIVTTITYLFRGGCGVSVLSLTRDRAKKHETRIRRNLINPTAFLNPLDSLRTPLRSLRLNLLL
jgi:hypothetical protein